MQMFEDRPVKKRVFIQRDYSQGMVVRFQTKLPEELDDRVNRDDFENTIFKLNELYEKAEEISPVTYCEGCLACLTGYLLLLCRESHYKKILHKASKYIDEQNIKVYAPCGVVMRDPFESGLRSIEFVIFEVGDG